MNKANDTMAGLYVHIPFCERKCIYCNFYSIESMATRERFLDAVVREIAMRRDALQERGEPASEYDSIFFGGGTPSLLSPDEIARIIGALTDAYRVSPGAEVTMECNPGAITIDWLAGYRDIGVNRISFGVQSFNDDELRFLSRIHTADEARQTISVARAYFENVSLDLIFALPSQTREGWRRNLQEGVALGTPHISAYSLIFEQGTPLNSMRLAGTVRQAPDSLEADMYEETMATLADHGFYQYEVSNYSRPGHECRHNLGYWERRSYLAFGPSAHGFVRRCDGDGIEARSWRWANVSSISAWLDALEAGKLPVASTEIIGPDQVIEELVYLGLRSRGLNLREFSQAAGIDVADIDPTWIGWLVDEGYARFAEERLQLTTRGYPFADRLTVELVGRVERARPELWRAAEEHVLNPISS